MQDYIIKLKVKTYIRMFFWITILEILGYVSLIAALATKTDGLYSLSIILCILPYVLSSIIYLLLLTTKQEWGWKNNWHWATVFAFIPLINVISLYFLTIINMKIRKEIKNFLKFANK